MSGTSLLELVRVVEGLDDKAKKKMAGTILSTYRGQESSRLSYEIAPRKV